MARMESLWAELQADREQRERARRDQHRGEQQLIARLVRAAREAHWLAAHAEVGEKRRQVELAHEAAARVAAALTDSLDRQVAELSSLLSSALAAPVGLTFAMLRRSSETAAFDPGELAVPIPPPSWDQFEPPAPGRASVLLGGRARHSRAIDAAQQAFSAAVADHENAEAERRHQLDNARNSYDETASRLLAEAAAHNAAVDDLRARFVACDPDAAEEFFSQLLALSEYPEGFPHDIQVAYRQNARELVIEYRLPSVDVVPVIRERRYVKARNEIAPLRRPVKEVKDVYASVIYQIALRTMWECFALPAGVDVIDAVVFNGVVSATNRATGQPEQVHLISAPASREKFSKLILDQLDPAACLKYLKAIVSPHPYDIEPVEPVIEFQKAKYRFADPVDALAGIDSRPDLLRMDWYRFENLIRQLFEAMGLEAHVTQSSRDEGIDAVAYNKKDIVHRAEILIQAKRYSSCVPANDVRALAGSVEEKRASLGILVTTAWVGPETKAFAARNNRLQIIEGGELKHLLAEHLHLDVRIDLPRRSRRAS